MLINLINLDRSPDRLAEFTRNNSFVAQLRRFPGIDGKTLDLPALIAEGMLAPDTPWSLGAIGSSLSHVRLWEAAMATRKPVTVCEDDVVLNRHFVTAARTLLHGLPPGWDFVLWGWNFDVYTAFEPVRGAGLCIAHLDQNSLAQGIGEYQSQRFTPQAFRLIRAFGQPCYTISPKGAALLRQACIPLRAAAVALPEVGGSVVAQDVGVLAPGVYPSMQAYLCFPPLAATPNDPARSTVLAGRPPGATSQR
jgi:GR25 family glycosyltransferase involved in LPS biosynthesis